MRTQSITLTNKLGLHARAAGKLVQCAAGFESEVRVAREDRQVNAKSIMGVLMLAAPCGTELQLECEGPDEEAALAALVALIDNRFGEAQ
ncbi:MAG: HPr family phosphocarrier protein [Wenzhouxiangellaceae bacterium]|nr:HPr family phosphocarrier protein [Wenzhouxiangellaceae bacterium]